MRHGIPPIIKMQQLGLEPSLSTDVETNMSADFFTQMRSAMTMQRLIINQAVLDTGDFVTFPTGTWPAFPANLPPLLNARDVLRFATINGAKGLRLDRKVGSLSPGKEADILILYATSINVAPLNHVPGSSGHADGPHERRDRDRGRQDPQVEGTAARRQPVEASQPAQHSRDFLFDAAGVEQDLFRS